MDCVCAGDECAALDSISTSAEVSVSCVCGVYPALTMRLRMCILILWLHWMLDVSGCVWLDVYAIMLMSVCVPHSVPPGWTGDGPWMTFHGPGMCLWSQRLRVGFHVCCPYVPAELWKVMVMVVVSMAARNQWALLCSGINVVVCASIVVFSLF